MLVICAYIAAEFILAWFDIPLPPLWGVLIIVFGGVIWFLLGRKLPERSPRSQPGSDAVSTVRTALSTVLGVAVGLALFWGIDQVLIH